jgi:GNAT superfamily N-acetyltransferase
MIRDMIKSDIPLMTELGARMHLESEYSEFNYAPEKCFALGDEIVASDNMCGFVAEVDGVVMGMFIGASWCHYFSDATLSSDLLLYVSPDCRGGMTGLRLIKAYLAWAKSKHIDDIRLGETAGIDREVIAKLYNKLGFDNYGTIYRLKK